MRLESLQVTKQADRCTSRAITCQRPLPRVRCIACGRIARVGCPPRTDWDSRCEFAMARMRLISAEGRYRVTVSGRLTGQDLGRLERLCGPALEHETPPLALRLTRVSTIDPSARAYLDRLVRRGATLQID